MNEYNNDRSVSLTRIIVVATVLAIDIFLLILLIFRCIDKYHAEHPPIVNTIEILDAFNINKITHEEDGKYYEIVFTDANGTKYRMSNIEITEEKE